MISFARMGEPKLLNNRLTYSDLSYTDKENQYCAKASKMEMAEYIEARVNQSDADYAVIWGFVPGDGIRQAYKRFLTNPGEVTFSIDPSASFNLGSLHLYNPKDIPPVLGLRVKVNGQEIEDIGFKTVDEIEMDSDISLSTSHSFTSELGKLGSLFGSKNQATEIKRPAPSKKEKQYYRSVKLNEIGEHVGREVKIYIASGLVREGTLERVQGSTIFVVRSLRGGKFTMPIPYGQVTKIEAFY